LWDNKIEIKNDDNIKNKWERKVIKLGDTVR
jgi:hypothetical protein